MRPVVESEKIKSIAFNGKIYGLEKWAVKKMLGILGNPPIRTVLWNGEEIYPPDKQAVATTVIRNRKTILKIISNPNLHFGNAYSSGQLEVEGNLVEFLETVYRSMAEISPAGLLKNKLHDLLNRPRANTLFGSKLNIHHHYNIEKDFYRLWLDQNMQYTCAYFPSPSISLEEAQTAKMDHVCRKLRLKPEQSVVEAGCGWGGLSLFMAKNYGVRVKAYNISHEQIVYARNRAGEEGLNGRVDFIEDDYRNISGKFDAFVSVGMLEHVGKNNYKKLGEIINKCLREEGCGLIHSIGRNTAKPINTWMEKNIFPGAYIPTLREMMGIFEPWEFSLLDVENLRMHYAQTLELWLKRFENKTEDIIRMYDQRFVRAWRLYLAGSLAAFTSGDLQLYQVLFSHQAKNDLPWSRRYMYQHG